MEWRKSSFSGEPEGSCVEVSITEGGGWLVRNSRHPASILPEFTIAEVDAFIKGVRAGEFD